MWGRKWFRRTDGWHSHQVTGFNQWVSCSVKQQLHETIYFYPYMERNWGKQWQATPKNLPRMQRTRAIPVAWLNSGLCPDRPKGWIPIIFLKKWKERKKKSEQWDFQATTISLLATQCTYLALSKSRKRSVRLMHETNCMKSVSLLCPPS